MRQEQQPVAESALAPFQQALTQGWEKALESFQSLGKGPQAQTPWEPWEMPRFTFSASRLQELQKQYIEEATELWREDMAARARGDRRFAAEAWGSNPVAAFSAAVYLLNTRTLLGMAEAVEADAKTRARLRFAVEQWVAASALKAR
jgi:polyhydroxyalkanoate synthase